MPNIGRNDRCLYSAPMVLTVSACGTQPLDPDCTAEKAARGTAMKASVGVGGRCTPAEAAADTARRKAGID